MVYSTSRAARRLSSSAARLLLAAGLMVAAGIPALPVAAQADLDASPPAQTLDPSAPAASSWLEPRGLSVVDLVGVVPESMLRDSMVTYAPGAALAYYQSGARSGNRVIVNVRFASRDNGAATCLGMPGDFDAWPTAMPAGTLRILSGNTDVTKNIIGRFEVIHGGLVLPTKNTAGERYFHDQMDAQYDSTGALILPANFGCKLFVQNSPGPLRGVFTFSTPQYIAAQVLGSQSLKFHSYIGPGYAGALESLKQQMQSRYDNRHDDLNFSAPGGTEFVWVKYPATPVAPWDVQSPSGGTYRIRRADAKLSVDHQNSMGTPLFGQWLDAGQSGGATFLPYFTNSVAVTSPEYFVPQGVGYDPCMTNGGCSTNLLQRIHDAEMNMTVYYFTVNRIRTGLQEIPVAPVGPKWSPGQQPFATAAAGGMDGQALDTAEAQTAAVSGGPSAAHSAALSAPHAIYLPLVHKAFAIPADIHANCPCGWFAADGRMVDFVGK